MQSDQCGDVTTTLFALSRIHEFPRFLVAELHVIAAPSPLPLAVGGDVPDVVFARALQ